MRKWLPVGLLWAFVLSACAGEETVNQPPVARAGDDAQVFLGDTAVLDGSTSLDPEGVALTYEWRVDSTPAGATLALGDVVSTDASLSFVPDVPGGYVFVLTVTDDVGLTSSDVAAVTALNVLSVTATVPADGAIDVAGRTPVVVYFSESIRPWTAESSVLVEDITDPLAPVAVLGNVTLDDANTAVVFTPVVAWADLTPYRVTVTTAPKGLDGAPLRAPVESEFTGASVDLTPPTILVISPPDAATNAPVGTVVTVIFSEPIDATTVPGAFQLQAGAQDGYVIVSSGDTKATFIPADTTPDPDVPVALTANTTYDVSLLDTITDQAATPNALDGDADGTAGTPFASSFQTVATDASGPPRIVSISPFPGSLDVSVKLPVVVTFSEPVAPSTVLDTTFFLTGGTSAAPPGTITMAAGNTAAVLTPDVNLETSTQYDVTVTDGITDLSGATLDGDGDGAAGGVFGSFFRTGLAPPPTVLSVIPVGTPTIDTTTILDVYGEDFVDGAVVFVLGGGVLVNSTTFISDTQLQADVTISPSAVIGPHSVQVTNPDGGADVGLNLLDILDRSPIVGSTNPAAVAQGDTAVDVDVFGQYFRTPPGVTVSGADVTVNSVTFVSGGVSSQVTINVDVGALAATGFRDITLTNPDGQSSTLVGALEVTAPPPVLNTIDITSGRRKETIDVTLTGTEFQAGAAVSFGAGIGVTAVDDTAIPTQLVATIAIAGNAAQGARNVIVTNPDGGSDSLNMAFDVLRAIPQVTGTVPGTGSRQDPAGPINVVISGADFDCSGGTTPAVDFNDAGVTVNMVTCTGTPGNSEFESEVTANVTIGAGASAPAIHNVTVTNNGDVAGGTGFGVFTVLLEKPVITMSTPDPEQGETRDVTVSGDFFQATPTVSSPQGGITVNSVTYIDPMTLSVNLTVDYAVSVGTYDLTVLNPDGQSTTANVLSVVTAPPPTVTQAVPDKGVTNTTGLDVAVIGTGFQPGAGATTVAFSGAGITVNTVTVNSTTSITANIDIGAGAATTLRDITVTNPVGTVTMGTGVGLFQVTGPNPTITSIVPSSGDNTETMLAVTINGTNFRNVPADPVVSFGAGGIVIVGGTCTYVSATQIDCTLDLTGATIGFHDVTVTNADTSSVTEPNGFQVTDPAGGPAIAGVRIVRDGGGALLDHLAETLVGGRTHVVHILGSNFQAGATVLISGPNLTLGAVTVDPGGTRIDVPVTVGCSDIEPSLRDVTVINTDGKSATRTSAVDVRNGMVINEVVTSDQSNHGCGGTSNREMIEFHNSSGCTYDLNSWHLDMIDNNATSMLMGTRIEQYSGGSSRGAFLPGAFVKVCRPDNGGDNMQNDIFLALYSNTGRFVDDVEIGDDPENDGNDGGPAVGNDGGSSSQSNESVGRCPDGRDTANDVNDFYQDEGGGGVQMASTNASSNNGQCPVCSDGLDNDGDGWTDFDDPGCSNPNDNNENDGGNTECSDGMDNGDGDGLADENDPDCFSGRDDDESI